MRVNWRRAVHCLGRGISPRVALLVATALLFIPSAHAGMYSESAHGNSARGVLGNLAAKSPYARGNCVHCHEQHASIGGAEPAPGGGPDNFLLFAENHTDQKDNICFDCHGGTYQSGGVLNRTYSFRAGGYTADPVTSIMEAFDPTMRSAHNLDDISTFLQSQNWGYAAPSNPCTACHNPHAAQGDPIGNGNSPKSSSTRGYPLSRPSRHAIPGAWDLWGDGPGEKMQDLMGIYQAPLRYNPPGQYEPDGSAIQDGSNLTDMVTLCSDCHNGTNTTIFSTPLGRKLRVVDWTLEVHGQAAATDSSNQDMSSPYQDMSLGSYVLACTDCHEAHGSSQEFLIRKEVNGGEVSISTSSSENFRSLCSRCHASIKPIHHNEASGITGGDCGTCHSQPKQGSVDEYYCSNCHYHGAEMGGERLF